MHKHNDYRDFGYGNPPAKSKLVRISEKVISTHSPKELYEMGYYFGMRDACYKNPVAFCMRKKVFLDDNDIYWHKCHHIWNKSLKTPGEHTCRQLISMEEFKTIGIAAWDTPALKVDEEL